MRVDYNLDGEWIHSKEATYVAWAFAAFATLLSLLHVIQHLVYYSMPGIQVYVVRILFIVPVYAISSALAIQLGNDGLYSETIRDIYEALVLYSFLNLILEFCGGETDCIYQIENEAPISMPFPLCFMGARPRDARLMRFCKRGVLQFIIVKPVMAVLTLIMIATNNYFNIGYVVVETLIYNFSYGWALYCLLIFYMATNQIIKKFKPLIKFSTVKIIIFATYYQSVLVKGLPVSAEDGMRWNDLLICIEMVIFAMLLLLAFPIREFQGGIPDTQWLSNMGDVLNVHDMVQDVYHNFMPTYHDYVVQRSEFEAPETVRVKTFLAGNLDSVALEMANRYRGRNKRLAFNSLLRGNNPLFARKRIDKRIMRDGNFSGLEGSNYDNNSSGSSREKSIRFRAFPEDEDLEAAIEFGEDDYGLSIDDENANGILVTSVLDLIQDDTQPADSKSLNFLSAEQVYKVYKSRVSGFQETLMQADEDDKGIRNEIHVPYHIDPQVSNGSVRSYMNAMRKKEVLNGFCERREYRELGKIGGRIDSFDEFISASTASSEVTAANEEAVVVNPMFDCSWDHNIGKSNSQKNSSFVSISSKNQLKGSLAIPILTPYAGQDETFTKEDDQHDTSCTELLPFVVADVEDEPNSSIAIVNCSIDSNDWSEFRDS